MKNFTQIFLVSVLVIIFNADFFSQSLPLLEKRYNELNITLQKETKILDSLKLILEGRGKAIDFEKKKSNPDKDKIVNLMASSAGLSNRVEYQQKKVTELNKDFEGIKKELDKKYSHMIDSLSNLKESNEYQGSKNELESKILLYTERKLLVSPKLLQLSFHPEKILQINLKNSKNSLEKNLHREYLQSALNEVNTILAGIEEVSLEVSQIITLQRKTKKFLEEAEFEDALKQPRIQSTNEVTADFTTEALRFSGENISLTTQVKAYSLILNQLSTNPMADTKFDWDTYFNKKNIDINEYKELLDEVKEKLIDYRFVLSNKIKVK
jgi:hypothetical protein